MVCRFPLPDVKTLHKCRRYILPFNLRHVPGLSMTSTHQEMHPCHTIAARHTRDLLHPCQLDVKERLLPLQSKLKQAFDQEEQCLHLPGIAGGGGWVVAAVSHVPSTSRSPDGQSAARTAFKRKAMRVSAFANGTWVNNARMQGPIRSKGGCLCFVAIPVCG